MSTTDYDIIVFGATSFVGKLVCRYLAEHLRDSPTRWAAAGRSREKLNALQGELGLDDSRLPLLTADAGDEAALTELCRQTRVIISTVGPYALYGEPMIRACVETGTDYCDLTGEVQWIQQMIQRYENRARETGARIVHCCGFDSIPSDLGVYFLQQQAKTKTGAPCPRVKMRVRAMRGGFSGGTVASLINVIKEVRENPALRKVLANPYALCPDTFQPKVRQYNLNGAAFDEDAGCWIAPFVMGAINTRVVHRSNALAGPDYGEDFRYDEAVMTGVGMKGRLAAWSMAAGLAGLMAGGALKPTRYLLERFVLPKPGEGPSPAEQESGFYDLRFFGECADGSKMTAKVTGDRDPGYGSTAKMLSQAALCLHDIDRDTLTGGFWTPATAMGEKLIERLEQHAGLRFEMRQHA